ncbi:hypothetical protein Tco_0556413 [Tanacetum coccineum]
MSIQDMEDLKQQYLDEMKTLINGKDYRNGNIDIEIKINELKGNFNEMSIEIRKKEKEQLEQVANLKPFDPLLIMENEHLDTIPETKSDEFIKSSVENLVQTQSESEDEFSSVKLNPTPSPINSTGKLNNINLDPEGDILFLESLLYDNSSPRPPEAFQDNSNTIIESLPTFPIPVKDSDSLREEIDVFPGPDDSIPPGIESDDFDSEDDDNSTSLPEFESILHLII